MPTPRGQSAWSTSLALCRFLIAFPNVSFTEHATIYALVIFKVNGDTGCTLHGGEILVEIHNFPRVSILQSENSSFRTAIVKDVCLQRSREEHRKRARDPESIGARTSG
jgi:hypothetical protein